MPIFRYDSDGYPSSTSGDPEWKAISNIYRWTGSTWQKIKKIYRFNNNIAAKWQLIFQGTDAPQPQSPFSSLYRTSDNGTTTFSSGNTVRLSRGSWTQSPTSYRLRIQTSQSAGSGYTSVVDQTYNSSSTPTAANTTNDTFISYTITDQDALHPSYYIKGLVTATNADGTTPLETTAVLLRIGFTLSNLTASSATPYGATFSWSISGVPDQSVYIYDQVLTIRRVSDNVVVKTVNVAAGTNSTTVSDSINLSPNTSYYAKLVVTAYDSWFLTDSPTTRTIDNISFTTAGNPPVNTVAPTIGPLNNRGYLPVSTTLTATQGTWSNVFGTTVYAYDWWKEDYISGVLSNTGYTVNTQTYGVSDALDYIFVRVRATNTDGGVGTAVSTTYTLDQAVAVGSITPTTVNQSVSTNFVFNISHYPTSYIINWGDGTSNYSSGAIAANTSTVNASIAHTYSSGGTYTITVTAQPGSKTNTATITVQAPISITFNANSGTLSSGPGNGSASYTYTGASGTTFTAPSATRTHYTFSTWRNPLSGGDPYFLTPGLNYTYGVSTGVEISRTFFAIWTANTYTVSYNYNGGTGSPASASVQYPGSVTLPSPTRSGHTFNGWYTASSGGSFVGGAGSSYSPTSNITLFAQWSVIQYTVTWNANGGSVSPSSNTVNAGGSVTAPTPTRSGFNFVRWTDTPSGDYFYTVLAGGSFTPPSSITMYARWQAAVSIPSGGSVSLTGGNTAGSTITASTSGWSGSPTSYDVYITTALSPNIPTSSSSRVASSGGGSSTTYTITSFDTVSPVNIFRAFATASNSAGTSGVVQSSNTITAQSSAPATQPGTPGTPTNGWTGGTTYPFSWTAPGAGTVAGGGAATITNYSIIIYEANNAAGTGAVAKTPFNTGSGSSSYTYTSPNAALYYAASVAAINSAGLQGPYSGISQYK